MIKEVIVIQRQEGIEIAIDAFYQQAVKGYDLQGFAKVEDRKREDGEIERLHKIEIEAVTIYFPSGHPNSVGKIELQPLAILKAAEAIKARMEQKVWLTAKEKGIDDYFSTLDSE